MIRLPKTLLRLPATGSRHPVPGAGRLLIWDPHTVQWRSDPLKAVAALPWTNWNLN